MKSLLLNVLAGFIVALFLSKRFRAFSNGLLNDLLNKLGSPAASGGGTLTEVSQKSDQSTIKEIENPSKEDLRILHGAKDSFTAEGAKA